MIVPSTLCRAVHPLLGVHQGHLLPDPIAGAARRSLFEGEMLNAEGGMFQTPNSEFRAKTPQDVPGGDQVPRTALREFCTPLARICTPKESALLIAKGGS